MNDPHHYDLYSLGLMLRDWRRNEAYAQAIAEVVETGDVVIDIGAGSGLFSVLAARAGATRVVGLEPSDAIEIAKLVVLESGLAERVELRKELSSATSMNGRRADVCISDLHGILPLFEHHIPSIVDARKRLLRDGGRMIPKSDTIKAAAVESRLARDQAVGGWENPAEDLSFSSVLPFATNQWRKRELSSDDLLTEANVWAVLDYQTIESPNVEGTVHWHVPRDGHLHGFALWFDCQLSDSVSISNEPGLPSMIYGQAFFPTSESVKVARGDEITLELRATLLENDYLWEWRTTVERQGKAVARFDQTTFRSLPLHLDRLRKHSEDYVPRINEGGRIQLFVLARLAESSPVGEIADALLREFPSAFVTRRAALSFAGDLAERYA